MLKRDTEEILGGESLNKVVGVRGGENLEDDDADDDEDDVEEEEEEKEEEGVPMTRSGLRLR